GNCFSWYFLPGLGARSGRALTSHSCSSAAKPRPSRMRVGSCATASVETRMPARMESIFFMVFPSGVIRVQLFPVYQPVPQRHERVVEREAKERDYDHQRQHAVGLEGRERVGDEIAQAVEGADQLRDDGDEQGDRQGD